MPEQARRSRSAAAVAGDAAAVAGATAVGAAPGVAGSGVADGRPWQPASRATTSTKLILRSISVSPISNPGIHAVNYTVVAAEVQCSAFRRLISMLI